MSQINSEKIKMKHTKGLNEAIEVLVQELAYATLESMDTFGGNYTLDEFRKKFDDGFEKGFLETLSFLSSDNHVIGSGLKINYDKYVEQLFQIYSSEREKYPITHSPRIQVRDYQIDISSIISNNSKNGSF